MVNLCVDDMAVTTTTVSFSQHFLFWNVNVNAANRWINTFFPLPLPEREREILSQREFLSEETIVVVIFLQLPSEW